jgi:AcrR family transcriptional regulator
MVDAALATLIQEGYARTSARAIAQRSGLNPALTFYHYGSVDELLLAALDKSSQERLERYRCLLASEIPPPELVREAANLFREDVEGGHVIVLTELIGASLGRPELRAELVARMRPWLELTSDAIRGRLGESPLSAFEQVAEPAAFALVSLYLGLNMLSRLERDASQVEALFELAEQLSLLVPRAGGDGSSHLSAGP